MTIFIDCSRENDSGVGLDSAVYQFERKTSVPAVAR